MYFGRCLVTGGTGWLGRHIVAALEAGGNEVVAVGRGLDYAGAFDVLIHAAPIVVPPDCLAKEVLYLSSGAVLHKSAAYLDGYAVVRAHTEQIVEQRGGRIARLFSFLGPGIPLDAHYAASTFLSQALAGGPVIVNDGAIRSYLHPKDLASALLTILAHGDREPYDVGGEEAIMVGNLGRKIADAVGVDHITSGPIPIDIYLPDLRRLKALGWKQTISTDEAITDTLRSLRTPV